MYLDDDSLVHLLIQYAVCGVGLYLLSDGRGNGWNKGQWAQIQIVAKDFSKHLWSH